LHADSPSESFVSTSGAFPNAGAIVVNRDRFVPVKTTNDLLAVMSDIYQLDRYYHLVMNPQRKNGTIFIEIMPYSMIWINSYM